MATIGYGRHDYPYVKLSKREQQAIARLLNDPKASKKLPQGEDPAHAAKRLAEIVRSCR